MIKIITGIRRCGKSFLLFVLFKKYLLESGVDNEHIIEIALDGIENEELRDPKKCYQYIKERTLKGENMKEVDSNEEVSCFDSGIGHVSVPGSLR